MLASSLLVSLAFVGGDETLAKPAPVDVTRQYWLCPWVSNEGSGDDSMNVFPLNFVSSGVEVDRDARDSYGIGSDDLIPLLQHLVEPRFWEEGGSLQVHGFQGGYAITCRAPEEIQKRISATLQLLESQLLARHTVRVRVYKGKVPERACVQDIGSAAAFIGKGLELIKEGSTTCDAISVRSIESVRQRDALFDWEVEIAQGAAISDPVFRTIQSGLRAQLRAMPTHGGWHVDLIAQISEELSTAQKNLFASATLNNKSSVVTPVTASYVDHPNFVFGTWCGSFVLPAGKALWVPVSCQTCQGVVSYLFELESSGPAVPAVGQHSIRQDWCSESMDEADFADYQKDRTLTIAHIGGITSDGLSLPSLLANILGSTETRLSDENWLYGWIGNFSGERSLMTGDALNEQVLVSVPSLQESSYSSSQMLVGNLLLTLDDSQSAAAILSTLSAATHVGPNYEVSGMWSQGREEIGRFRVPMTLYRPARVYCGRQHPMVCDWDVDVANESSIANPEVAFLVDGYVADLTIGPSADGGLRLSVTAISNRLEGPPTSSILENTSNMLIDRASGAFVRIVDSASLPAAGGEASWTDGQLTLTLKLTRN